MFAVQAIWAFQLLVSTALLAKVLTTFQKIPTDALISTCKAWDKMEHRKYHYKCSQLTAGVVCDDACACLITSHNSKICHKLNCGHISFTCTWTYADNIQDDVTV